MGLWDDAQAQARRDISKRNTAHDNARIAAAVNYANQQRAINEFADGMQRLGIQPTRHKFWTPGNGNPATLFKSVTGWDAQNPRNTPPTPRARLVISTSGELFEMTNSVQRYKASDLSTQIYFGSDPRVYLEEMLQRGLTRAIRGD